MPWHVIWNGQFFDAMFHLPQAVPIAEKMLRPIIVYLFLVVLLRVFGKRELAQLNPFDLVVLLSLANTVQNAIIGDDTSLIGGLIGATSLCAANYCVIRFLFKHRKLDQVFEGTPTVLIDKGKVCPDGMTREMLSESELITVAHRQGFATLEEIESAVLEPGGTFFMRGKEPRSPERRHAALLAKIEELSKQMEDVRKMLAEKSS